MTVGRGTQNYTCASAQSAPKLQGAVARLYDTSCLARRRPRTLDALPAKLLAFSPEDLGHSRDGHHFFNAAGTPIFDMSAFGGGVFAGALAASVKGPPTADYYTPSQAYSRRKRGNGDGRPKTLPAINWLRLTPVAGSTEGRFREGFRVVTAGGTAPESCKDQPAHFEVPYATEYCAFLCCIPSEKLQTGTDYCFGGGRVLLIRGYVNQLSSLSFSLYNYFS